MGRKQDTEIRSFFICDPLTKKSTCKTCGKLMSSFLTNLKKHLSNVHNEMYMELIHEEKENDEIEPLKKMKKIQIETNADIITDCCVNLVTKEDRPFTLLDSEAFRKIMEPIFKGLNMTLINSRNIADIIAIKAEKIRKEITDLCKGKLLSIKIDLATRLNRSVMRINVQVIHSKKVMIKTFAMIELHNRHTAEILKTEIVHVLQQYDINVDQIYSFTTDNGRNLIKAVDLLREDCDFDQENENENENCTLTQSLDAIYFDSFETVRCAAHTL